MSLRRLWDHKVLSYRATRARDEYGDPRETWAATGSTPTRNNARPDQNWSGVQQDQGPGEQQASNRRWFLDKSLDVAERDVLSVLSGPESGALLRVLSVTSPTNARRIHHFEVNVEVWTGSLDGDGASS